jgi:hypothetical protein
MRRRNPEIPENILKRFRGVHKLAEQGSSEDERAAARNVEAVIVARYPGIEAAAFAAPPPTPPARAPSGPLLRPRKKPPVDPVYDPTADLDLFPWDTLLPEWAELKSGIFVGVRPGGAVDLYVNNTYKTTSPSLRGVVYRMVELARDQPGQSAGVWKGYNVFVCTGSPPVLDTVTLGDLAYTVGLLSDLVSVSPGDKPHVPRSGSGPLMEPDDFSFEDE